MGRYKSYLDLILANVYNLEFLDVTVIYMSYMNVYIYICYTIYIYLDYTVTITFNSLLIMGLLVRYIVYIIYVYTIDVSTYQYDIQLLKSGAILNATILKIYLEITIDYETRIYSKNIT